MGKKKLRCVFDTNVVISALVFSGRRLAWLRRAWLTTELVPLASQETIAELVRVLEYPKFRLAQEERLELLGDYLPFCDSVDIGQELPDLPDLPRRDDPDDQKFLKLAAAGEADWLITGDPHLLKLAGQTRFSILEPALARDRLSTMSGGSEI